MIVAAHVDNIMLRSMHTMLESAVTLGELDHNRLGDYGVTVR